MDHRASIVPELQEESSRSETELESKAAEPIELEVIKENEEKQKQREPSSSSKERGPIVVVENVHKTYLLGVEGVPALRGVSVKIMPGEFVTILGKSGGGKTSLLNIIGTIDTPTKGFLKICGTTINSRTTDSELAYIRLKRIGFCFQTFNLISSMSAIENVELPMVLDGTRSGSEIHERASELLESIGLKDRKDHRPSQLSGGEQQRVTIARAVANNPDILLLDEPTGDLDSVNSTIILQMLCNLNQKEGITMVMVTHDISLKYLSHRTIHMVDGKINKVEHISKKMQNDSVRQLTIDLDELRQKGPEDAVAEIEVRDPFTHYAFHRFSKMKKEKKTKEILELKSEVFADGD